MIERYRLQMTGWTAKESTSSNQQQSQLLKYINYVSTCVLYCNRIDDTGSSTQTELQTAGALSDKHAVYLHVGEYIGSRLFVGLE